MKMQRMLCALLSIAPWLAAVPGGDAQVINTYAGGVVFSGVPALTVPVSYSEGIAYGSDGNVYFSDLEQCTVDRYDPGTQTVTQVAGNNACGYSGDGGPATSASVSNPQGVALDGNNNLYIADEGNNVIRRVDHGTGIITTVAGTGSYGYTGDGGAATSAELYFPYGVALDGNGNLYIATYGDSRVRAVNEQASPQTLCGVTIQPGAIQTVAGTGTAGYNGDSIAATSAEINDPLSVAVDGAGDLYISDRFNNRIRRVDASTGIITTIAGTGTQGFSGDGGLATQAEITQPEGVSLDSNGNIFFSDLGGSGRVRSVTLATGDINTVVAQSSDDVAVDPSDNVYLARVGFIQEYASSTLTDVVGNYQEFWDFYGDGEVPAAARLDGPWDIASDPAGDLFIADPGNQRVRRVDHTSGLISTFAGGGTATPSSGPATSANILSPKGLAFDATGNLYFSDGELRVLRVDTSGNITIAAGTSTSGYNGDGIAASGAELSVPYDVAVDAAGNLYIADIANYRVRAVNEQATPATLFGVTIQPGDIATVAGDGTPGSTGNGGLATSASLYPPAIAFDAAGNLYIVDTDSSSIRRVDHTTNIITAFAGNGTAAYGGDGGAATSASLHGPNGVAFDAAGNLYIADTGNERIRVVNASTGNITTLAGNGTMGFSGDGGPAISASFNAPLRIGFDGSGFLYVGDASNNRVRRVSWVVPSVVGDAQAVASAAITAAGLTVGTITQQNNDTVPVGNVISESPVASTEVGVLNPVSLVISSGPTLLTPTVTVMPSQSTLNSAQALSVTVSVGGGSGNPTPTGSVTLSSGTYTSSPTVLSAGSAVINVPAGSLAVGSDTLTATYAPDSGSSSTYAGATGTAPVTVSQAIGSCTTANPNPNPNPVSFAAVGDFNGDCKSDVLWRNTSTQQVYEWLMNGTTFSGSGSPGSLTSDWVIQGAGDFDGDGKADILSRNSGTGVVQIWLMNGTTLTSTVSLGHVSSDWIIAGVGDFNGDGYADILWRNTTTNQLYLWLMNGTTITGGGSVSYVSSDWVIQGIGDFNGDGDADILWRNSTTGQVYLWLMNGTTIASTGTPGAPTSDWVIQGVGDFDGNGMSDILWRNSTTGQVYLWFMNGTTLASSGNVSYVSSDWVIQALGDYDGSGRTSILWRNNSTYQVYIWLMNGTTITSTGTPGTPDSSWHIYPLSP